MPSGLHSSGSSAWPILLRPHNILVGATHPDTLEPDVDWLERTLEECTPVPHVGGELTDFIIVLHDLKAVKAFCNQTCIFLLKQAAGSIGRAVEADVRAGDKGSGTCYTYSCSKVELDKQT